MSESITPPTIRVRISHDKTSKGWRCNETTVEITGLLSEQDDYTLYIQNALRWSHEDGLSEARRRNILEGFPV